MRWGEKAVGFCSVGGVLHKSALTSLFAQGKAGSVDPFLEVQVEILTPKEVFSVTVPISEVGV